MSISTQICNFGWIAPDFLLPATDGKTYTLADVRGPNGVLVMFICNHCPYVKEVIGRLVANVVTLQSEGTGAIAIMSNDPEITPDDSFDKMKIFASKNSFTFPYVIDQTQQVARAYDAICTPDFFGFNSDLELQYRGRFDDSGRKPALSETRRELLDAMRLVARTGVGPSEQIPSMGCSIKWRQAA